MRPACRFAIAVHPVKTRADYLSQWGEFSKDERRAQLLRAQGQKCGAETVP